MYVCTFVFNKYVVCIWQPEHSPGYETIENGWVCFGWKRGTNTVKNLHAGGGMRGRAEDDSRRREEEQKVWRCLAVVLLNSRLEGPHFSKTFQCFRQKYLHDWMTCLLVILGSPTGNFHLCTIRVAICFCECGLHKGPSPTWIRVTTAIHLWATSQTSENMILSNKRRWGTEKMGEIEREWKRWECCSLGCRLGGGAWKRPCHGLPLVESAQYPSNHPAPSLSSLPSVNRAGEQEMVWRLPWKLTGSRGIGGRVCYPKKAENWGSQRGKSSQWENLVSVCVKRDFTFLSFFSFRWLAMNEIERNRAFGS